MTYKIAWVQPNFQQGPKELGAYFLPYSAGILWTYAIQDPWVREQFELTEWIWARDDIDPVVERLSTNDVVAFSTYVWNHNYNYELARRIKARNPRVLTIFGGPEPAITDPDVFRKNPFMDLIVCLEGEITMQKILRQFETKDWRTIPGLLINTNGAAIKTRPATRIENLENVPSPYLEGIFDKLIADNPNTMWQGTLETNRGCPYQCTFCDWGSLTYNKVKKFNLERVYGELEWMAKRNFDFISITDANFGMFVERDSLIADKIIECQETYGSPRSFSITWAKNQKREVIDIVKKLLNSRGFNQGVTLSVQSLDLDVLENVKRSNMEINKLEEVFEICEQSNIPVYTELILGLPGETLNSWKNNFYGLFKLGNHTGITVFQAQLLENAEMNLTQKKQFEITSQAVSDYFSGNYSNGQVEEYVDVIISTKDMPLNAMLEAQVFSWFINTFHISGVSTHLSRFVNRYSGVEYSDFYQQLYDFIQDDPWLKKEQSEVSTYLHNWMSDGRINHPNVGMEIHGWNLIHRSILNLHVEKQYDGVFDLLERFMQRFDLPRDIFQSLMQFQRQYLVVYDKINTYPMVTISDYNIWEYIAFEHDLIKQPTRYLIDFPENKNMSFSKFLELIYFARRRNFGKITVERLDNDSDNIDVARRGEASARVTTTNTHPRLET